MKLQQAYFAEQNLIGGWTMIGYKDPSGSSTGGNTTNFTYGSGDGCTIAGLTPNFDKIGKAAASN